MPRIRQVEPNQVPGGRLGVSASPATFGSQIGGELQRAGQALSQVARQMQQRQERQYQLENERILAEEQIAWQQRLREAQENAPPGAPEFTDNLLNEFSEREQELIESRPTQSARQHMQQNLVRLRTRVASQAVDFQAEAGARYEIQQVEETVQNNINSVRADPSLLDDTLADVDRLSSELPVDAQRQEDFRQQSRPNLGFAHIMGRLDVAEAPGEAQAIEEELVETDRWKDLLTNSQYQQALNRSRKLRESLAAQQAQEYMDGLAEQRRQWEQGFNLDTDRFSPAEIRSNVGDPERQNELVRAVEHSKRIGRQTQFIRTASPQEVQSHFNDLQARVQAPITEGGDFDQATRELQAAEQALERRNKAIQNDRARYVIENTERVGRLYEQMADSSDEDALDHYIAAATSEQRRLGIPAEQVRLLPNEYVGTIEQELGLVDLTPEGAQDAHNRLRELQQQFGQHWPTVQRQLEEQGVLTGPMAVAAGLDRPEETRVAQELIRASAIGRDGLKQQVDRPGLEGDLSETLSDQLADFQATITEQVGGARVYGDVYDSVELMTMRYMARGESLSDAAEQAYADVVGNRYEVRGTYRIPKQLTVSSRAVDRGAQQTTENLSEMNLVLPQFDPAIREEDAREQWVNAVQANGRWVTNPEETGLQLVDETGSLVLRQVGDEVVPVEFSWEQLEERAGRQFQTQRLPEARLGGR